MSATPASRRRGQLSLRPALLRRGWVLPWTALVVAALAYGVATLQSTTYNAEAVLTVSPAIGTGPGSASQANELAATYANAIPRDEGIDRVLVRTIGRSAAADGTVDASLRRGLRRARRDLHRARAKRRPQGRPGDRGRRQLDTSGDHQRLARHHAHRAPPRRHPPVPGGFEATFTTLVPAGGGRGSVVSADQANKLAASYAGLISRTTSSWPRRPGRPVCPRPPSAPSSTVFHDQETSILRVRFQADYPELASKGARTVAGLVSGDRPVTATVLPSSIEVVSLPPRRRARRPRTPRPRSRSARSRPRARLRAAGRLGAVEPAHLLPRDITAQIGCPATPVDRLSPEAANALLERWASLSGSVPARVAILPANEKAEAATDEAVRSCSSRAGTRWPTRTAGTAGMATSTIRFSEDSLDSDVGVVLLQAGSPGGTSAGEAVALESDLTVIVIPKSMTAATGAQPDRRPERLRRRPVWALMTTA